MVTPVKRVPIHLQSAQNRLIIKNGTVVNDDGEQQVDIYIEDSVVRMVGNHLIIPGGTRSIDATGKYILPGGIDLNVHLQRPAYGTQTIDDFYQGTKAALAGGTTMVVDLVIPEEGETLKEAHDKWRRWAENKVCCDYALKMALPRVDAETLDEMEELATSEYGVNIYHLSMAGRHMLKDNQMLDAMEKIARLGGLAMVYAENGEIVKENERKMMAAGMIGPEGHALAHPEEAEVEAVMRACVLANSVDCPLYVTSVTSGAAADILKRRRAKGSVVVGEVTPAGLACEGSAYWNKSWIHAAAHVCSPPLREGERDALLAAAAESHLEVAASQHAAYNTKQKALGKLSFTEIPLGITGVEERLLVLWQKGVEPGRLSRSKFVSLTAALPAKLLNLYPQKGKVAVGSDADIVIWDPTLSKTLGQAEHQSKCDFNLYEGLEVTGGPEYVICRGRVVLDQGGVFRPMQGFGQYQPLPPFPAHLYDQMRIKKEAVRVVPVTRDEADMPPVNGTANNNHEPDDDIPPPTPDKPEKPASQHRSSFDLNAPDDISLYFFSFMHIFPGSSFG